MVEFGPDVIIEIQIDPETGQHTSLERFVEKTPEDIEIRLAELTEALLEKEKQLIEQTKAELEEAYADWRSAQELKQEGVYTQEDIDARQDRVKELKAKLKELTKGA